MEDNEDDIGKLFRTTFEEHHAPLENEDWEGLNAKLQRRNFFHFNALQFNIFYAAMIIFCFVVCLGVGSHYTYTNLLKTPEKIINNETVQFEYKAFEATESNLENAGRDTINSSKSPLLSKSNPVSKSQSKKNLIPLPERIEDSGKINPSPDVDILLPANHVAPTESVQQAADKQDSIKPKPKRTIYITKQDTIFQFDTIQPTQQKKKRFK